MSKRSLEFEDYTDPKKQKINESSDYNRCSPLLFFDDHFSNQDNENNNVITEILSDNLNVKNPDNIANGFSYSESCEKLVDSNQNVEKCDENFNSEIVEGGDDNGLKVQTIVSNVTESILDTTQVVSNTDKTSPYVENSILHNHLSIVVSEDNTENQRDEINNKVPINELTENNCQESVGMDVKNDEIMVIEVTSATVFNSDKDCINEKQDLSILNNSDVLTETNILPIESEKADLLMYNNNDSINENKILPIESDDVKIARLKSKTQNESLKSDYKLRSSSTKLEISKEVMTPQKDTLIRKSARISKGKNTPVKGKKTPLSVEKTLKNNKTSNCESLAMKEEMSEMDNSKTPVKRRTSLRIETLAKNKKVKSDPKKSSRVNSRKKTLDRMIKSFDCNDLGTWPQEVPNDMKIDLIKKGPVQIESRSFPRDDKNRCFSTNSFFCYMPNGEKGRRFWVTYSESQDVVHCFACRLFSYDSNTTLANVGSNNWKKLNERLCHHESSPNHLSSMEQWCQFLVDKEGTTCGLNLTQEKALSMVGQLKNYASKKSNNIYLLAKQLESEMGNYVEKVELNIKQQ